MTDPNLIADLIRAGVDPDLIARVSVALVDASVRRHSADVPVDLQAEKRRSADRERKRNLRNSADNPQIPQIPQTALLLIEDKNKILSKKERATRLSADWRLTDGDRKYALDKWMPADRIVTEAEKFKNYWIAKSGSAATKTNWSATWQNWVMTSLERVPGVRPVAIAAPVIDETIPPAPGLRSSAEIRAEVRARMAAEKTRIPENEQCESRAGLRGDGAAISPNPEGNPDARHQAGNGRMEGLGSLFQRIPRV